MNKTYLLTPGPTPIPETVTATFAQPIIHHRTPAFESLFEQVRSDLKYLFQTQQDVILLTATGTRAMDAAVSNLFRRGDQVIVINTGEFGERWALISKTYGLKPIEIILPPGEALELSVLEQTVRSTPEAKAILFQASETSTGAAMPVRQICEIAQRSGILSVCDAITACGVIDLPMDTWGIDVMITGSQKALMIPPGLSMIALSNRAWASTETSDLPHFYFDLRRERKNLPKNQTAWTPCDFPDSGTPRKPQDHS